MIDVWSQQTFSVKGQMTNISGFANQMVCHNSVFVEQKQPYRIVTEWACLHFKFSHGWAVGFPANAGDSGLIPGSGGFPGKRNGNPLLYPVFLPGISHGWRRLAGYSLWGHKELEMT